MGSITATPANGILVTYSVLNDVPGIQNISFASWLIWGVPLVIVFVSIAALILSSLLRLWGGQEDSIHLPFGAEKAYHPLQKFATWIAAFYFSSSFALSLALMHYPERTPLILVTAGILTSILIIFLFCVPVRNGGKADSKQVLLTTADCYNEMPLRGFLFVGIALVLATVLYACNLHELFSDWAGLMIPTGMPTYALFFVIALATSFSTELLSNTAIQLSFFVMAVPLAESLGFSALAALMLITLSCTCAFMSPIATVVNGLAFGGIRGVSITRMLFAGFIMNIVGALLISGWILLVIGPLYGLD
jgi:sodium-dependent dicarboxylate transporter 2/3/5